MTSVGWHPLVPLRRVFPVGFSADSAELARFLGRWFNASNEADFAEFPRGTVASAEAASPSNGCDGPARTTENLKSLAKRAYICGEQINGQIFDSSFATMPGGAASSRSSSSHCRVTAGSRNALRPTANRNCSGGSATVRAWSDLMGGCQIVRALSMSGSLKVCALSMSV